MTVAIVGSRSFNDYSLLKKVILSKNFKITKIISGGAQGADSLAKRFANEYDIEFEEIVPNWRLGKGAGIIRNKQIVQSCDVCFIFWNGKSKGTKSCLDFCIKFNKPYYLTLFS
jgi:hypothetical protein